MVTLGKKGGEASANETGREKGYSQFSVEEKTLLTGAELPGRL